VTIEEGTNVLGGTRRETIMPAWEASIGAEPAGRIPRFWDGKSAERIADHLAELFRV
jgi:UDP-N-acetylglucosamine 2-epimerase (non-hydrolysing)